MPIYEFYCGNCNTIYNFFSKSVNTEKVPSCPKCKDTALRRKVSLFAAITGKSKDEGDGEDGMPPMDESKMEKAFAMLASEAGKINEDDPRQAARLMRKLSEATGLRMGSGMEEALSRMERGDDPDRIEQEMGDLLEGEDPFLFEQKSASAGKKPKPQVDATLYDL